MAVAQLKTVYRFRSSIAPPVEQFETVSRNGLELPHRRRFDVLQYFAQIRGGAIRDRFFDRSSIAPPVAQFDTVSRNGLELPHQCRFDFFAMFCPNQRWSNSRPFP